MFAISDRVIMRQTEQTGQAPLSSTAPSALASRRQLFLNMIKFANSVKISHKNTLYFHARLFNAYVNFLFYLNSIKLYLKEN